jgi:hypothetical protein
VTLVVAGQQQPLGLLDAPAGDELVRRLVEGLGEQAVEVERRKAGLPGGFGQKNGPRVVRDDLAPRAKIHGTPLHNRRTTSA